MEIYFLRHGDAETALFNTPEEDRERQLTPMGEDFLIQEAIGIKKFIKSLDVILTSPARRAVQTAEIFGKVFKCSNIVRTNTLQPPCNVPDLLEAIAIQDDVERVLCVGHAPAMGELASEMITGIEEEDFFNFRKGGILRMDIDKPVPRADARLVYFLDPDIPKLIGELLSGKPQTDTFDVTDIDPDFDLEPAHERSLDREQIHDRKTRKKHQQIDNEEEEDEKPVPRKKQSVHAPVFQEPPDDLDYDDDEEEEEPASAPTEFHIEA